MTLAVIFTQSTSRKRKFLVIVIIVAFCLFAYVQTALARPVDLDDGNPPGQTPGNTHQTLLFGQVTPTPDQPYIESTPKITHAVSYESLLDSESATPMIAFDTFTPGSMEITSTNGVDPLSTDNYSEQYVNTPTPTGEANLETGEELVENVAPTDESIELASQQWIVTFSQEAFTELDVSILEYQTSLEIKELSTYVFTVRTDQTVDFQEYFEQLSGVLTVEENGSIQTLEVSPNDQYYDLQTNLSLIDAPAAWETSTGAASVVIAVLDTGVDLDHPDLSAKILAGYDFVNDDSIAQDDNGHGSCVAGIAAASSDNNLGITGVSWGGMILPVKVLDSNGNGSSATVAEGIVWAVDQGADVINLSLGGTSPSQLLTDAITYAIANNVVVVASTGNNAGAVLFPANSPDVIAVAATDALNNHADFSNYGDSVDVSAPGMGIISTSNSGGYMYRNGTSMSAPQVSGLAAIILGMRAANSPGEVADIITSTAKDLGAEGWDPFFGWGLMDMSAALDKASIAATAYAIASYTATPTATVVKPDQSEATITVTPTPNQTAVSTRIASQTPTSQGIPTTEASQIINWDLSTGTQREGIPGGSLAPTTNPNSEVSITGTSNEEEFPLLSILGTVAISIFIAFVIFFLLKNGSNQ